MTAHPSIRSRRRSPATTVGLLTLLLLAALAGPAGAATSDKGDVYVIHGIVGQVLDVYLDGTEIRAGADPKSIVGPVSLNAGRHSVKLRKGDKVVAESAFTVRAGQSLDVVAHLRSDQAMTAEITTYRNDRAAVAPGRLRLVVTHTAAAPPADIRVNGKVLFSNVANGEALSVVVPAGPYSVDIVPAATDGAAILGPVELSLKPGTLTKVYAIGSVATGTMDAVVHRLDVATTGAAVPRSVPTGDGGQAAQEFVTHGPAPALAVGSLLLFAAAGLSLRSGRRRAVR
jgi:hypothetical protein